MQKSVYTSATVVEIMPMCASSPIYKLSLVPHDSLGNWSAGQFLMVRFSSTSSSFARPFSIACATSSTITLYIHIRGKETKSLRSLEKGDILHIWGPLGSSYSPPTVDTLLIAGGIGIAPFVTYTNQYRVPTLLFFGHRIQQEHYPLQEFPTMTMIRTFHDKDAYSLQSFLDALRESMLQYKHGQVLVCGPLPLLRYVRSIAIEYAIYTELSLEETMFCGVGACLGCVCKTSSAYPNEQYTDSYIQSCTAGPVFVADTILI